jgi:chromosome segregation ATPase
VRPKPPAKPADEERISLFWRVFGGTILSIVALVAITLFNNLSGTLAELRSEITKLHDAKADTVRKDEFNARTNSTWERVQGIQSQVAAQTTAQANLQTELAGLKERLASVEGLKKEIAAVDVVKERLAALFAETKAIQDDLKKVRADVDRNVAADEERKTRRDTLQQQTEEALKELTKGIQMCREKLARLEGAAKPDGEKKPGG